MIGRNPLLAAMGIAQLLLWSAVAISAERFDPARDFAQRPLLLVTGLAVISFLLYLASLALVWKPQENQCTARLSWRAVLLFAVLFRLPLWWSQPIQELDIYRYLWDGRVLAAGINPYRYSPAQLEAPREGTPATPDLESLANAMRRSPEVTRIFSLIDHRSVPTIYPPLSEAVFAVVAMATPERAPVRAQVRVMKAVLLLFDLATIGLVMGLLRNLGQPPSRALAYAWCPLALKEFANTGHLDSIAVCLTTAALWLLTRPRRQATTELAARHQAKRPATSDWLAAVFWAGAVLAKLYPLVLAPGLLVHWWRRLRWHAGGLVLAFAFIVFGGYAVLPPVSNSATDESIVAADHSSFSGLGEFFRRWEMNDLLFSIMYENVRLRTTENHSHEPWYSVLPITAREHLNVALARTASAVGMNVPANRLLFLFTQVLAVGTLVGLACILALRRWPDDPREELLRRAFLCLACMWFLSATQNPWYWTWALPLIVFASRPWQFVSGFALIYYLRFWLVYEFPKPNLPGGLNGQRFFDEVVVWIEHLLPLLTVVLVACLSRKTRGVQSHSSRASGCQLRESGRGHSGFERGGEPPAGHRAASRAWVRSHPWTHRL